jgi:chromosome segregation ATPase
MTMTRQSHPPIQDSDLRKLIVSATQQIEALEAERCALEEVCDELQIREHDLSQRLSSAEENLATMTARAREATARGDSLESKAVALRTEIRGLERSHSSGARRGAMLARELKELTDRLSVYTGDVINADQTLSDIRESVAGMEQRILFARQKRSSRSS